MEKIIRDLLVSQFKHRVFEECYPRIFKCLDMLDEDQVWWRPNESSNSIGNLILHLCGNCRQWICTGLGGEEDDRKRAAEFQARKSAGKEELTEELESLRKDLTAVLDGLRVRDLVEERPVQIYRESGVSILVHVIEHFSYHTGQIAYIAKMLDDRQLTFYDDEELNRE